MGSTPADGTSCVGLACDGGGSTLRWLDMRLIGRTLQLVGLVALPVGIMMEVTGQLGRAGGLSQLLIVMVFGLVGFYLGRVLEGYAQRS